MIFIKSSCAAIGQRVTYCNETYLVFAGGCRMDAINQVVGRKIRNFRKAKGLTLDQLAKEIYKSKATLSKYESGFIAIDVATLYKIAAVLHVRVEQLLYIVPDGNAVLETGTPSTFFKNSTRFYSYFFDGRSKKLVRCVIDILPEPNTNRYQTMLYMNIDSYADYQHCENTYWGHTEHYDTLTVMNLKNQATPLETISINILAPFMESHKKWGLMSGVSFRPFMPIALKMLFSRIPLDETADLRAELTISKEDIKVMKMYNMLAVT